MNEVSALKHAAAARHLPQQEKAAGRKENVGEPHRDEGGDPVLLAEGCAEERERVVEADQQDGEDPGRALAAAPRCDAERNPHQHEHEAGSGIGESLVRLDQESLAIGPVRKR